jgi:hypothetical protein
VWWNLYCVESPSESRKTGTCRAYQELRDSWLQVVCFSGAAAAKKKVVLFFSDVPVSHWGIWLLNPLPVGLFSPF